MAKKIIYFKPRIDLNAQCQTLDYFRDIENWLIENEILHIISHEIDQRNFGPMIKIEFLRESEFTLFRLVWGEVEKEIIL